MGCFRYKLQRVGDLVYRPEMGDQLHVFRRHGVGKPGVATYLYIIMAPAEEFVTGFGNRPKLHFGINGVRSGFSDIAYSTQVRIVGSNIEVE